MVKFLAYGFVIFMGTVFAACIVIGLVKLFQVAF